IRRSVTIVKSNANATSSTRIGQASKNCRSVISKYARMSGRPDPTAMYPAIDTKIPIPTHTDEKNRTTHPKSGTFANPSNHFPTARGPRPTHFTAFSIPHSGGVPQASCLLPPGNGGTPPPDLAAVAFCFVETLITPCHQ